jgi:hypothetical protein
MHRDLKDAISYPLTVACLYIIIPFILMPYHEYAWFNTFLYSTCAFLMCIIYSIIPLSHSNKIYLLWEGIVASMVILLMAYHIEYSSGPLVAYGKFNTLQFTIGMFMLSTIIIGLLTFGACIITLISVFISKLMKGD